MLVYSNWNSEKGIVEHKNPFLNGIIDYETQLIQIIGLIKKLVLRSNNLNSRMMKRLTLLAMMAVIGHGVMAQNVWDGTAIPTFSTNGRFAVGASSASTNQLATFSNTNNSLGNGVEILTNNTHSSTQNALTLSSVYSYTGAAGKTGIRNNVYAYGTGVVIGIHNGVVTTNTGSAKRYGISSVVVSTVNATGSRCAIYGNVADGNILGGFTTAPNDHRAGFFVGATEIISANDSELAFIINRRDLGTAGIGRDVFRVLGSGKVYATEINVKLAVNFPDYVFLPDYDLMPLEDVKEYISENGHLPNVPAAETVEAEGMDLGEMNRVLVEKIEELTLYLLQQEERIKALEAQVKAAQQN